MTELRFTALGRPQPAGSKKGYVRPDGGVTIVEDAKRSKPWQAVVAAAATEARNGAGPLAAGPVFLAVTFVLARPRGHFGTGRNAGQVKASAPEVPAVRPDTTKLLRAVEDALTGVVWRDDAQVVVQVARKVFGAPERAEIVVSDLENGRPDA